METFIEFVLQFNSLNKQQIDLIKSKATDLVLKKGDFYWQAGETVEQVGFIKDGVMRAFHYDNKGKDITRYFFSENHLILSDIQLMKTINLPFTFLPLPIVS